jgi:aminodeoxyfutalosine synthase
MDLSGDMTLLNDPRLREIQRGLQLGQRPGRDEALTLFLTEDIPGLGLLADRANLELNGDRVFYINNAHINYTNICVNRCRFCAYRKSGPEVPGAFFLSPEEVLGKAREIWNPRVRELHIVGGCHPDAPLDYYIRMLSLLRREFPEVFIQSFTAVEIEHIARKSGLHVAQVLTELRGAGLGSLPGGGGEIFSPAVRQRICPEKISGEQYLEVMRLAHRAGIPTNVTMLFGHIESVADRVDHLLAIRSLQDNTGGFNSFIPLVFHPANTGYPDLRKTSGVDILRTIAASRLILDNIRHIKAFWIMLGLPLTQIALFYGADDVNGTVVEERITHDAGAETPQHLNERELIRIITEAGRRPLERDTLYRPVARGQDG